MLMLKQASLILQSIFLKVLWACPIDRQTTTDHLTQSTCNECGENKLFCICNGISLIMKTYLSSPLYYS